MKVKELIKKLQQFDPEETVLGPEEYDIQRVELIDETRSGQLSDKAIHCRWIILQ